MDYYCQNRTMRLEVDTGHEQGGGEGKVYPVTNHEGHMVKIYHRPTKNKFKKLNLLINSPLRANIEINGHLILAWPLDVVENQNGNLVGFVMRKAEGDSLFSYLDPKTRRTRHTQCSYKKLIRVCRNIASVVELLHRYEISIGDVNFQNILVQPSTCVSIIDCDSMEIMDRQERKIYPCPVGLPDYTPPEYQAKTYTKFYGGRHFDEFAITAIFFQVLMEGVHPFSGYDTQTDEASIAMNIESRNWPYDPLNIQKGRFKLRRDSPPLDVIPQVLQPLFFQCFREGLSNPDNRPDARTWRKKLEEAETQLMICSNNNYHVYSSHLNKCPWCVRADNIGQDTFPN